MNFIKQEIFYFYQEAKDTQDFQFPRRENHGSC